MEYIKALSMEPVKSSVEAMTSSSTALTENKQREPVNFYKKTSGTTNVKEVEEETNEKINRIAEAMDSYVQSIQRDLKIQVHSGTGNIMVKVISQDNGKVIREIPPKELLDLAARMEEMAGTLFDENV